MYLHVGKPTTSTKAFLGELELNTDSDESSNNSSISVTSLEATPRPPRSSLLSTTSTITRSTGTGSLDLFVDKIHQSEEDKVWVLLARACYASNTPLNFTENVHWKRVFHKIKPSLQLPSRYQLSNFLLEKEYERIHKLVSETIKKAKTVGIQIDGWSNIRNEPIINVIITTPDPVLYKVIDTKTNRHDANYLCNLISSIINEIGLAKVMTIITDNASNMRATWELLQEKYSFGYFSCYGCCAHILNLLINDILKIDLFSSITEKCKTIVNSVKRSHILNATFTHIQKEQHDVDKSSTTKTLKLPAQTRWASILFCLQSLRLNKQNLKQLAITETVLDVIRADVKQNILDDSFWKNVDIMYYLLQPICEYTIKIQTSRSCISEVVEFFFKLNLILNENCPLLYLDTVQALLKKRKEMALRSLHYAANLLDPKYMGNNLSSDEYIDALTFINKLSSHLISESNIGQVMTEVALYKAKEGLFAKDFLWAALSSDGTGTTLSSVVWWKSLCATTNLSKVAVEILNCPTTTCATERSFSAFANIHNKKRNKLTNDRASKLLFVSCNLKLGEQNEKPCTSSSQEEPNGNEDAAEELLSISEDDCIDDYIE